MTVRIKECGQIRYNVDEVAGRPAIYFDFHHPGYDNPEYNNQRQALYHFKDGYQREIRRFAGIMADIAAQEFGSLSMSCVLPILGSSDRSTNKSAGQFYAAELIAERLGIGVDTTIFAQRASREKLHSMRRSKDERRDLVAANLQCNASRVKGKRVLLVDDVLTSGASVEVYAESMNAHGAVFVGSVFAMRTEGDMNLLNPWLYDELARRIN